VDQPDDLPDRSLTVWQPWAWAIVSGHKRVENRPGPTRYRGRIGIHAGRDGSYDYLGLDYLRDRGLDVPDRGDLPHGALVGEVTLIDCRRQDDLILGHPPWRDWLVDGAAWAWLLADAVVYTRPLPCRGQLGLWSTAKVLG
jgi:ASCH domain